MRVLVVEDEPKLARYLATGLRRRGMAVDVVGDGESALRRLAASSYDVLVLDRDLPGMHGDEVCRRLAEHADDPAPKVLMLTASGTVLNRVEGLGLGADDYLTKPFAFMELVARVHALARRRGSKQPPILRRGVLELDPARMEARVAGSRLGLNRKEFAVLHELLAADGGVVTRDELRERVWAGDAQADGATVRVTMYRLRQKLGDPALIETVPHVGYRAR